MAGAESRILIGYPQAVKDGAKWFVRDYPLFCFKKNFFLGDIKNSLLTKLAHSIRLDTGLDLCIYLCFYGQPTNLCERKSFYHNETVLTWSKTLESTCLSSIGTYLVLCGIIVGANASSMVSFLATRPCFLSHLNKQ